MANAEARSRVSNCAGVTAWASSPTASAERVITRRTIRQPRRRQGSRAARNRLSLPEPEGPIR